MKKPYRTNIIHQIPELPEEESLLSLYDEDNPDLNYFNSIDEENIRLGGSKLKYYKYLGAPSIDDVYQEERNKVISKDAIILWAYYDPKVLEESLGDFGIEAINDQIFQINKSYALHILGEEPRPGDIIQPFFQDMKFEIFEVQEDGFEIYGAYRYNLHARLLRDSEDVVDEPLIDTSESPGGFFVDPEEDSLDG